MTERQNRPEATYLGSSRAGTPELSWRGDLQHLLLQLLGCVRAPHHLDPHPTLAQAHTSPRGERAKAQTGWGLPPSAGTGPCAQQTHTLVSSDTDASAAPLSSPGPVGPGTAHELSWHCWCPHPTSARVTNGFPWEEPTVGQHHRPPRLPLAWQDSPGCSPAPGRPACEAGAPGFVTSPGV